MSLKRNQESMRFGNQAKEGVLGRGVISWYQILLIDKKVKDRELIGDFNDREVIGVHDKSSFCDVMREEA